MKHLSRVVLPVFAMALALACAASEQRPPPGSYGFDEMKPETTSCKKLNAAQIAKFKNCTYSKSNSFGDDRAGYACKVSDHSTLMAYTTLADCKAELELEQANGD